MANDVSVARLRRVSDASPGFQRRAARGGFSYHRADGQQVRRVADLARIRALAIPPAWADVWICSDPDGHIQATGRDARGRKQYRYHSQWSRRRDARKYDRMLAFARRLPAIRRQVRRDLARTGLPRPKALAAVVRLLDVASIRVGNSEYARKNNSFGLTTLRRKHVTVKGAALRFSFTGKGRIRHAIELEDRALAAVVKRCLELPGLEVFKYEEGGKVCDVTAADVNDYLREIAGADFSAKDFRTWTATVVAVQALMRCKPGSTQRERKTNLLSALDLASERLGNTRAICRKSYVHPLVEKSYLAAGALRTGPRRAMAGMPAIEAVVLGVVQRLR